MHCSQTKIENYKKTKKIDYKYSKIQKKRKDYPKKQKNILLSQERKKTKTRVAKSYITAHRESLSNPQPSNYSQDGPLLNIVHLNIQGLNCPSKQALLSNWMQKEEIDIFAMSEVKLTQNSIYWMEHNFFSPKYVTFNSIGEAHYGVSIIVKKELAHYMKMIASYQGKAIMLKLEVRQSHSINLIYLYNSFRPRVDALFEETIHRWIDDCKDECTIVFGDFNQTILPSDRTINGIQTEHRINNFLPFEILDKNLIDIVPLFIQTTNVYTHEMPVASGLSRARIDHVLCSKSIMPCIKKCSIEYFLHGITSTHFPIHFSIDVPKLLCEKFGKKKRKVLDLQKIDDLNWTCFLETQQTHSENILNIFDTVNLDEKWSLFKRALISSSKEALPYRTIDPNQTSSKKLIIKSERDLFKVAKLKSQIKNSRCRNITTFLEKIHHFGKKYNLPPEAPELCSKEGIIEYLNRLLYLTRKLSISSRKTFMESQIKDAVQRRHVNFKTDLATCLRSCLDKRKQNTSLEYIKINSHVITKPDDIKNSLDVHFKNLFSSTSLEFVAPCRINQLPEFTTEKTDHLTKTISLSELKKAIISLGNNKASGPSGIYSEHLKHLTPAMENCLLVIMNECLSLSMVPTDWLLSTIYLIPKDQNWKGEIDRMRPITLMEVSRKVLSKILNKRLYVIIDSCFGLTGGNYGFSRGLSTTMSH